MTPRMWDASLQSTNPLYQRDIDVYEAALDRIRWLFDEFDNRVRVSFSGGKDSTCVLNLALIVARERGQLPLEVYWLDQEAEWGGTVDYCRSIAADPDIDFHWYQVPIDMLNSSNLTADGMVDDAWLHLWETPEPDSGYIHPRQPTAIATSPHDTKRFKEWLNTHDATYNGATLTGVRIQESPSRRLGMISNPCYKQIMWGTKTSNPDSFVFCPIWDWEWRDVWKAIYDHDWEYNRVYDAMFRHGVKIMDMRISALIHETAVHSLYLLHELEPDTWNRMTARIGGISATHHLTRQEMFAAPQQLPRAFRTWREYRDYLIEHLVPEHLRPGIITACIQADRLTLNTPFDSDDWVRGQITGVLTGYDTKIKNLIASNGRAPRAWLKANRPEQLKRGFVPPGATLTASDASTNSKASSPA